MRASDREYAWQIRDSKVKRREAEGADGVWRQGAAVNNASLFVRKDLFRS